MSVVESKHYASMSGCVSNKSFKEPIIEQNWDCLIKKTSILQVFKSFKSYLSCEIDLDCLFNNKNKCCK